jgi:hypothetical protein
MKSIVRFACPACDRRLKAPRTTTPRRVRCPACSVRLVIGGPCAVPPVESALVPANYYSRMLSPVPAVVPATQIPPVLPPEQAATVPLSIRFPNEIGGLETKVSPETANTIAKTVVGGALVAAGFVLAGMFGYKHRA